MSSPHHKFPDDPDQYLQSGYEDTATQIFDQSSASASSVSGAETPIWIAKMSGSGRLQLVMVNLKHAKICVA